MLYDRLYQSDSSLKNKTQVRHLLLWKAGEQKIEHSQQEIIDKWRILNKAFPGLKKKVSLVFLEQYNNAMKGNTR